MQSYLFIGGANDSLSYPVEDDVFKKAWIMYSLQDAARTRWTRRSLRLVGT